ncbi:MAG: hypothetical protein N2235_05340 [Fischerella sp.]|nr:hypothetical protein [Fischerella sp.]
MSIFDIFRKKERTTNTDTKTINSELPVEAKPVDKPEGVKNEIPAKKTAAAKKSPNKSKTTKSKNISTSKKSKAQQKPLTPAEAKAAATARGEPWVEVISIELDPDNVGQGAFEIDWNEFFVSKLIKAGYQGKTDQDIVDNWFQTVCRNIALETWEQYEADPTTRINRRNLGGGRTEVS